MIAESTFGKTMAYQYDPAGNRTRVTWPDAFYAQYGYDALGRMKTVGENGATSGVGLLATFTYDDLGRRTSLVRGNGTSTTYGYDSADRPTAQVHDVMGASFDQTFGFSWSPASQLLTRTASNAFYKWAVPTPGTTANAYDGLNRDSAIVTAGGYDLRGNLTADGSRTFTYDVENRMLTAVSGGTTVMFAYDPIGRLTTTATPASTTFLYDSDRLSAEYNASGTLLRRYVHGPGVDEPLVWYEGAGTTDRRWLHQDRQGSVIGWSNGSGTVSASTVYKYGPWGEPGDAWGAGSRFRYTGQIAIPEARLYHYKARMYDPATGRFMQTDPIGYKDDLDLYAYVGGDPVNKSDPTGLGKISAEVAGEVTGGVGIRGSAGIIIQVPDMGENWTDPGNWDVGITGLVGATAGWKGDAGVQVGYEPGDISSGIEVSSSTNVTAGALSGSVTTPLTGIGGKKPVPQGSSSPPATRTAQRAGPKLAAVERLNVKVGKVGVGVSQSFDARGTLSLKDAWRGMRGMFRKRDQ